MKANCIIRHQTFSYLPFGKYNLSESLCVANIAFLEVRQSVALPKTYYSRLLPILVYFNWRCDIFWVMRSLFKAMIAKQNTGHVSGHSHYSLLNTTNASQTTSNAYKTHLHYSQWLLRLFMKTYHNKC